MPTFTLLWLGQLLSFFGTTMTRFGLTIWAYQQTGQATTLALLSFFNSGAYVLFSPLAGLVVDRWPRKWVIALADFGAGLVTAGLLALYLTGQLEIWHLYLGGVLTNALGAFQEPAFSASVSLIVPRSQLTRANGMLTLADDGARMFAPLLGGALLAPLGVNGILSIDILTCLLAVGIVLAVRIPNPPAAAASQSRGLSDLAFGFRYIARHPGLAGILSIFTGINLLAAVTYFGILPAMILARSGGDAAALGVVQALLGIGGVVGGALLSLWGGPKNRVRGFLLAGAVSFLLGDLLFAVGRSLPVWIMAALASAVFIPFIISLYQAIWQTRVPAEVQGRVFATKNMLQVSSMPLGYLLAGYLADQVFEPALAPGGALVDAFGWLVGTGAGAGMGLMFALTCGLGVLLCLSGLMIPAVREVDSEPLPVAVGSQD